MSIRVNRPRTPEELLADVLERLRALEKTTTDLANRLSAVEES